MLTMGVLWLDEGGILKVGLASCWGRGRGGGGRKGGGSLPPDWGNHYLNTLTRMSASPRPPTALKSFRGHF